MDVIGKRIVMDDHGPRMLEIVSLVQDSKYRNLREPVPPTFYAPFAQLTGSANSIQRGVAYLGPGRQHRARCKRTSQP